MQLPAFHESYVKQHVFFYCMAPFVGEKMYSVSMLPPVPAT
jgi:hypothetical protein